MNLEELQSFWAGFFDGQVERLREKGNITPFFHIVSGRDDIPDVVMAVDGEMMNHVEAKKALSKQIRETINTVKAVAVASVLDTYVGKPAEGVPVEAINRGYELGMNVSEMAALGIVVKREALVATVESPIMIAAEMQFYRRDKDGNVTLEEREKIPAEFAMNGRFVFFEQAKGKAQ